MCEKYIAFKRSWRTFLVSLYFLVISSIFLFFNLIFPAQTIHAHSSKCPQFNASIHMNLLVVSEFNLSRALLAYQIWGKDFLSMFPNSSFQIVSQHDLSSYTKHSQQIGYNKQAEVYQNYIYGFTETLLSFCVNSTNKWYMRTTEDAFVDVRHLQSFIDSLEHTFDPDTDFVIKGQLCKIDNDYSYLHGGSGWIMSRKAACTVNSNINSFLDKFFMINGGDDMIMHFIQKEYGLSDDFLNTDRFLGTKLSLRSVEMLKTKNFQNITRCKKENKTSIQLNKVVVWHSGRPDNFPMTEAYEILDTIPDNIHISFVPHEAEICWM